jgi:hypothetical protein
VGKKVGEQAKSKGKRGTGGKKTGGRGYLKLRHDLLARVLARAVELQRHLGVGDGPDEEVERVVFIPLCRDRVNKVVQPAPLARVVSAVPIVNVFPVVQFWNASHSGCSRPVTAAATTRRRVGRRGCPLVDKPVQQQSAAALGVGAHQIVRDTDVGQHRQPAGRGANREPRPAPQSVAPREYDGIRQVLFLRGVRGRLGLARRLARALRVDLPQPLTRVPERQRRRRPRQDFVAVGAQNETKAAHPSFLLLLSRVAGGVAPEGDAHRRVDTSAVARGVSARGFRRWPAKILNVSAEGWTRDRAFAREVGLCADRQVA